MKKNKKAFAMHDDYHVDESIMAENSTIIPPEETEINREQSNEPLGLSQQIDQVVQGLSGMQAAGQVYLADVRQLEAYPDQPFKQYSPERLQELADDIKQVGVLNPILVRRMHSKLQILSGHNRWQAAKLAGLSQVPVLIIEADDDQAILVLTSTNLRQRENLLPSEKAFAYKMQMDALKRQGKKGDGGQTYDASAMITRQTGDGRMQIHRYIRLTKLDPDLLELLDKGRISMTPAVSISYLEPSDQLEVYYCIRENGASLTIEKANRLKEMAADAGMLGAAVSELLLTKKVREGPKTVNIPFEKIKDFLPEGVDAEEWIIKAVMAWSGEK